MARPQKSNNIEKDENSTKKRTGAKATTQKDTGKAETQKTMTQKISEKDISASGQNIPNSDTEISSESSIIITIKETDKNTNNIFNNDATEFSNDMLADTITGTKKNTTIELASSPEIGSMKRTFKETNPLIDLVDKEKRK